jgi:hypothetical protein
MAYLNPLSNHSAVETEEKRGSGKLQDNNNPADQNSVPTECRRDCRGLSLHQRERVIGVG